MSPNKRVYQSNPGRQTSMARSRAKRILDNLKESDQWGEYLTKSEWWFIYNKLIKLPWMAADGYAYYSTIVDDSAACLRVTTGSHIPASPSARARATRIKNNLRDFAYFAEAMVEEEWFDIYNGLLDLPWVDKDGFVCVPQSRVITLPAIKAERI
jgi:hypothetical protein